MSCYLTYTKEFQNNVINSKMSGMKVKDVCEKYSISVYTLYKILHMNGKVPIPSQVSEGIGSEKGVEHRNLSPNNNNSQERPASTWKNYGERHVKVKHCCLNCETDFKARYRGNRTKFCCTKCKSEYRTKTNSTLKMCICGDEFRIKNSRNKEVVFCKKCRENNVRFPTSIMSNKIFEWLKETGFNVELEKRFAWFYDKHKVRGRFRLDCFLPDYNLAIEYDGEQHFKPCFNSRWESVDKIQYRDRLKERLCNKHGIKTIRFKYDEDITKKSVLMKIYAELQVNEPVEVHDKKLVR